MKVIHMKNMKDKIGYGWNGNQDWSQEQHSQRRKQ